MHSYCIWLSHDQRQLDEILTALNCCIGRYNILHSTAPLGTGEQAATISSVLAEELLHDLAVRTMPVGGTTITEEGVEATMVRIMIMMDHTVLKDLVEILLRITQRDFEEGKIHITSVNHKIKVNRRWNHRRVAVGGNGKWRQ